MTPADNSVSWEKWRELSYDLLNGLEVETADPSGFRLSFNHHRSGNLSAASLTNTPHLGLRSAEAVRKRPSDTVSILRLKAGRAVLEFGDESVAASAGDMLIHDLERPFRSVGVGDDPLSWQIVHLRRSLLDGELSAARNVSDFKLDGGAAENRVLRSYLDSLHQNLGEMDCLSADAFEKTTVEMLRNALVFMHPQDHTRHAKALHRVQAALLDRMREPKLRIEDVSREVGIGPRTIHRLFQSIGTTPLRWIEDHRLKTIAQELRSTTHAGRSITQIALSCGYNDQSNFGRVFKRKFGVSPSRYRKHADASDHRAETLG